MLTRFSSVFWSHNYAPRNQCLGINYLDEEIDDNCLLKAGSNGVRKSALLLLAS
jgi:hypothetical protein